MVPADKRTAPASPLHLDWEPNGSWLRCVVRWPDTRPPLSRVLPLFGHLGLDLVDHRPEGTTDTFMFSRVEDPHLDELLPLLTEAFVMAWEGSVDRDVFASLVVEAQLNARQVQLVRAGYQYLQQAGLGASRPYVRRDPLHPPGVRPELGRDLRGPLRPARSADRASTGWRSYADAAATRDEFRVLRLVRRLPGRGHADDVLPPRRRQAVVHDRVQGRPEPGRRSRRIRCDGRDVRAPSPGRGAACALRPCGTRRAALVGPGRGLPGRGARSREGPAGQELPDRPGGSEGRVRRQGRACRSRSCGGGRGGATQLPAVRPWPARHHRRRDRSWCRSPGRSAGDRRSPTPTWWWPRTRAPRPSPTSRTPSPTRPGTGWATRSPPEGPPVSTTSSSG